ncbi:DNA polymerase III subunit delta' [Methylocapsa acidiphila]|uniref:DNA polymerase III subunit delta' n=1 Tax=Methylocapsa acidiphila TaxID=133552 RepID=UPI0003F6E154|nr:DNA polymerase III subunit delta' [Methylocapsa acidiphila]
MTPRPRTPPAEQAAPEADRFTDAPHPRETYAFFGHAEAEAELLHAYRSGRLAQAFVIGGPPGVGKATLAWRFARFLLADAEIARTHGDLAQDLFVPREHPVAGQIESLSHPDLFLLRRAWNEKTKKHFTEIRVDDVRSAIHMFHQGAGRGGYRVCIVDSAEDLNASGANALLKLIEEPPPRSIFLIVAHRPHRILPTIRSRCVKIALRPLGSLDMTRIVTELGPPWSEPDAAALEAAIGRCQGSMRDLLRLLGGGVDIDADVHRLLDRLPAVDWRSVHSLAERVAPRDRSDDFETLLVAVLDWLDDRLRRSAQAGEGDALRRLAPYAEVWEKAAETAREIETLNLDRRPLVFSILAELAAAARASSN